jgi:chorismate dehydratase
MAEEIPKLRMAAAEPMEDAVRRVEREQRAELRERESGLEESLAPFRVGSVGYLNAVPLTRGLEEEVVLDTPANLARKLQADELDAALVSVVEPLFTGNHDILDGVAIASLGEVKSVILAHRGPLAQIRQVACDTASLTSVELLRILLAEQGLHPEFVPLDSYEPGARPDYTLLIGDQALDCNLGPHEGFQIWDLGQAWYELTSLPFVYAVWALRRDLDTTRLRRLLRDARDFGLDTLDHIIRDRTEYTKEFRQDYLGWHIHYHLGADEKRGLARFIELLRKHGRGGIFEPKYVA